MNITLIGLVLVPLGLFGFLISSNLVYKLSIFFIPFTATAILVVGDDDASVILATVFFGSLWIIRSSISSLLVKSRVKPYFSLNLCCCLLLLFLLTCIISIVLIPLEEGVQVLSLDLGSYSSLKIQSYHLNHLFFVTYGVFFSILMVKKNCDLRVLIETLKVYSYSLIFLVCWGIIEIVSNMYGLGFPYYIFNNTPSDSGLGLYTRQLSEIGFFRMTSVGDEPQTTARALLLAIPLFLSSFIYKIDFFSHRIDTAVLLLMVLGLFATGSSSGIFGFLIVVIMSILLKGYLESRLLRPLLVITAIPALLMLVVLSNDQLTKFFQYLLVDKFTSESFLNRYLTIANSIEVYRSLPVFGAGFGSVTSDDLLIKLLSNTGTVGFLIFMSMLVIIQVGLLSGMRVGAYRSEELKLIQVAVCVLFFAYWLVASVTGWSHQFQLGFFVLGFAISLLKIKKQFLKLNQDL
jgi:hypothetical protein